MGKQFRAGDNVFGNWKILKLIGEGSYGRVYEIMRSDFGVEYRAALKIITVPQSAAELRAAQEEGMDYESAKRYFYTMVEEIVGEFALMSRLKGLTNVVSYEDHLVLPHEDGIGWDILIRMELLTPLLTYAYQHPFSRRDIIKVGIDLCKALELCQKYNIIHRDIKPENIFVSGNGDFKLGDFGIARTVEKTLSGLSKKGTYNYMAPEVYRGNDYGFSVDIYSLGIVLYRLLNKNRVPFMPDAPASITYSDREKALAHRMSGEAIPKPFYHEGRLPEIVLKACSYEAKERYSSPIQMRQELEAVLYDNLDAKIIYPDGDELIIAENQYISTGATQDENMGYSDEMEGTASIFGQQEVASLEMAATSRTESIFSQHPTEKGDIDKTESMFGQRQPEISATPVDLAQSSTTTAKKSLIKRKWVVAAVVVLLIAACALIFFQQKQQRIAAFNGYMTEASAQYNTDPAQAAELLLKAQALQPDNPEPFVGYAYSLYCDGQYQQCIDYIENDLSLGKTYDISQQSKLAEILGAAYFELEDYAAAASFFRLSTAGGDIAVAAMRDYAVSLGRLGDLVATDEVLTKMFDAGADELVTSYVQAEVEYAQKEYTQAEKAFLSVLTMATDVELQRRTIRSLAELYRDCAVLERLGQSPIANAATKEAELLADGMVKYGLRYDSTMWEMLAMAYFDAYHTNPKLDASWLERSADAFNHIIEMGVVKDYLYGNLFTIYYELGDYAKAEEALSGFKMQFPDQYTPHALRAMMLMAIENNKSQDSRNYQKAYAEFQIAEKMLKGSDDKTYYQQVKSLVDTLQKKGWL